MPVNVHEAKSELSGLIVAAEAGDDAVIARKGKPVVRLVPLTERQTVAAPFTRTVATRAGALAWAHRDPFDRLIAATAIEMAAH